MIVPEGWRINRASKFVRRKRAAVIAACVILITLIAGIAATAWEDRPARSERERSERRDLSAADPANAEARRDLAYLYERIGHTRDEMRDAAGAVLYLRKAAAIFESIVEADPTRTEDYANLVQEHETIAMILEKRRDPVGAVAHYRKAVAFCEKWLALAPDDPSVQDSMAGAFILLAQVSSMLGSDASKPAEKRIEHWREARGLYQRSLDVLRNSKTAANMDTSLHPAIVRSATEIKICDDALARLQSTRRP